MRASSIANRHSTVALWRLRRRDIGMVAIDIGFGEVGGQARVEWIELERPVLQGRIAGEGLEEVPPVPAGGFSSDLDGVEVGFSHLLSQLARRLFAQNAAPDLFWRIKNGATCVL
jgi:hypothetical protein